MLHAVQDFINKKNRPSKEGRNIRGTTLVSAHKIQTLDFCLTHSYVIPYLHLCSEMQLRRETEELSELEEAYSR